MYFALKHTHMLLAVLSIAGFIWRGGLRLTDSPLLQRKWLKITPHIIDTLLLLTAIGLLGTLHLNPFAMEWLNVKIIGLVVYIGLGVYTMRIATTRATQATGYVLAIMTFAYIFSVAMTKSPLPFAG